MLKHFDRSHKANEQSTQSYLQQFKLLKQKKD